MIRSVLDATYGRDLETVFRTRMAAAMDTIWRLGYDDEAPGALYDVIEAATIREEGEDRRGDLSE